MDTRSLISEFFVEPEKVDVGSDFMTIPNIITISGIVLCFLFEIQIITGTFLALAPITMFFAGLSDAIDGFAARRLNQHTYIGKFLDSLRDKKIVFALCFSVWWIKGNELILPLTIWIVFETVFLVKDFSNFKNENAKTHTINKVGQAIRLLLIGIILAEIFWIPSDLTNLTPIVIWVVAISSLIKFCVISFNFLFRVDF